MTHLIAEPQIMAAAAAEVEEIGLAISAANDAAAGQISGLAVAAGDEVSAAIANLFGAYGQECQAVMRQAAAFQAEFTRAVAAAGIAYQHVEDAAAVALQGVLGAPAAPAQAPGAATIPPFPANELSLIMGGTGVPIPSANLIAKANELYIRSMSVLPPIGLVTPEELYPITGVKSLVFDASVNQGLAILDAAIREQINPPVSKTVTVFGISQSAVIASLEMQKLMSEGSPYVGSLNFVLTGNEMNPNGGMLARFPNLSFSSLGLTFYGATPPDTPYDTAIYTLEYDGFADFPRYPLNIISDLNAVAGIVYVHPRYFDITPEWLDQNAIELQPSVPRNTHYYILPADDLPLLQPLRALPVIGGPLANLIEPNVRVIVNLGYGDPYHGYSTSPPDVWTPFGLFPDVSPVTVAEALAAGTQQGINNFTFDMSQLLANPPTLPPLQMPAPTDLTTDLRVSAADLPSPLTVANTVASIVSTDYAVLLPTADIALSLVTTLPAYNVQLFAEQLAQGNLINAIGYPIAANVGLATIAGAVEFLVLAEALATTIRDISSLVP
ncbi:PE family protein PE3 [Mycobacterium simulans]|uniref:PE family protein PE3 n=1 Tax=Mycobacterium simulans TaxID=627089 RepID=A0A7Z7IHD5_9MYCO|nr:PE-PPE domain-containing protein [Mycobacterium simulans]SOJ52765.1 PE family protein PE3 [Mycobacterium simulans]